METVDSLIFRAISEILDKSKDPDKVRICNFVIDFLDDSGVTSGKLLFQTYFRKFVNLKLYFWTVAFKTILS